MNDFSLDDMNFWNLHQLKKRDELERQDALDHRRPLWGDKVHAPWGDGPAPGARSLHCGGSSMIFPLSSILSGCPHPERCLRQNLNLEVWTL